LDATLGSVPDAAAPVVGGLDPALGPIPDAAAPLVGGLDPTTSALSDATGPVVAGLEPTVSGDHSLPPGDVGSDTPGGIVAFLSQLNPFHDGSISITDILGTGYMTWKLALFTAVLASLTRSCGNATSWLNVRFVTFTNVQLIRCSLVSPIVRMATAPVAALSSGVSAAGPAPSVRIAVRRPAAFVMRRLHRPLPELPISALKRGLGKGGALIMQIGKLLGLVYAAFLAIWFWATRLRWNGR
jgi:hypothetical protein